MEHIFRKVTFALNYPQGFYPDEKIQAEADELSRVRNGLYHGITEVMEDELKKCLFIIEDVETGVVHYVEPQLVKFIKESDEK